MSREQTPKRIDPSEDKSFEKTANQSSNFLSSDNISDTTNSSPNPIVPYNSMFIFNKDNVFRRGIHFLLTLKYFDTFIMIVISCSSIALATEDPVNEESNRNKFLNYLDYGFTFVFTAEMVLKVRKECFNKILS